MSCYRPLSGYYARRNNVLEDGTKGKRGIVFSLANGHADRPITVPCGRCIGCRLEYSRQWAVRCLHEVKTWERNCFVTLTYDDASVPRLKNGVMTLHPRDVVLFMKRVRKKYGSGIRFFQCGEYGDKTARPHHHALLFNHDFSDRVYHGNSGSGAKLFVSKECEELWGHGHVWIGEASFESAGYIARYSLKKVGKSFQEKDAVVDGRVKEYLTMSRRPGIGHYWAAMHMDDYFPSDEVVVNGRVGKVPRYYESMLEKFDRGALLRCKVARKEAAGEAAYKRVTDGVSLYAKEVIKEAQIAILKRESN